MHYAVLMTVVGPTLSVPGVIYPDCACDFHFLALIKNQLKVAGIIGILGQIVTHKFCQQ